MSDGTTHYADDATLARLAQWERENDRLREIWDDRDRLIHVLEDEKRRHHETGAALVESQQKVGQLCELLLDSHAYTTHKPECDVLKQYTKTRRSRTCDCGLIEWLGAKRAALEGE